MMLSFTHIPLRIRGWRRAGRGRGIVVAGALPPPNNGMTVYCDLLLRLLRERGIAHRHVDMSDHRAVSTIGQVDAVNVALGLRFWLAATFAIVRRPRCYYAPIAQNRVGLVRDAVPLMLCRALRVPRIVHLHGSQFRDWMAGSGRMTQAIARTSLRGATGVVLHETLRNRLEPHIPEADVRVIENAVGDPGPVLREATFPVTVLFLSLVSKNKGAAVFIDAASGLEHDRRVRFVLCGELQPPGFLEAHPPRAVRYVGPAHTPAQRRLLMAEADMFVLPSLNEGQPLAILEAMAAGLPVISTTVGAIPATVTHEMGGLLVEPGDTDALRAAIRRLVDDPALRMKMGAFNRRVYESRFRPERLLTDFMACVDEATS